MISKKYGIVILFLATMALPNLILVSYAQQPEQVRASIGDKVRLQSVRGSAVLRGDDKKWYDASMDLVGEITELNGTHFGLRVLDGGIQVGDEHYSIAGARLNAVYKRFCPFVNETTRYVLRLGARLERIM